MNFGNPHYLIWLWFIIPAVLIYIYGFKKVRRRLSAFAMFMPKLMGNLKLSRGKIYVKLIFITLALALMVLALAKPRWGYEWQMVKMKGSDVIIAVDVSRSMLATDVNPSRIERARREIIDLLGMLHGDRVGVIAFAGGAYVHCPLTSDYGTVEKLLEYLDPRLIRTQGTAIGEALLAASDSLGEASPESSKGRAVILISDGEDETPVSKEIISKLKANAIRVYTVGVGKEEGAPIPEDGGGFKKDSQGRVVLSKLDETELKRIASETGGMYTRSVSGDMDLASIYQQGILGKTDEAEFDQQKRKIWYERFQWFTLVAIILLVGEVFISEYRIILVLLTIAGVNFNDTAKADEISNAEEAYNANKFQEAKDKFQELEVQNPDDLRHAYNKGVSSYRLKEYDQARQAFAKSSNSKNKQLSSRSMYNLGNTETQLKNYDGAISAYEEALKIDPDFKEAKENLGIVKQLKEQKKQQNKDQENDDRNQDQQNKDDQKQNDQNKGQQGDDQKQNQENQNKDQKNEQQENDKKQQDQQDKNQQENKDQQQQKQNEKQKSQESKNDSAGKSEQQSRPAKPGELNKDQAEKLLREAKDQAAKYMGQKIDKQQRSKRENNGGKDW